jgi:hypothetical protein
MAPNRASARRYGPWWPMRRRSHGIRRDRVPRAAGWGRRMSGRTALAAMGPEDVIQRMHAGAGWKDGALRGLTEPAAPDTQRGYTLASAAPVVSDDLEAEQRFTASALLVEHDAFSGVGAVIQATERPFGVLQALSESRRVFSEPDVNFVQAVANVSPWRSSAGSTRAGSSRCVTTNAAGRVRRSRRACPSARARAAHGRARRAVVGAPGLRLRRLHVGQREDVHAADVERGGTARACGVGSGRGSSAGGRARGDGG